MKQNKITTKLLSTFHIFAFGLPMIAPILLPFYKLFANEDIMGKNAIALLSLNINLLVLIWFISLAVTAINFVVYRSVWLFKAETPENNKNNLINLILWLIPTALAVFNICSYYPINDKNILDIYQNLTSFWGGLHLFLLLFTSINFSYNLTCNSKEFEQLIGINVGFQQAQKGKLKNGETK